MATLKLLAGEPAALIEEEGRRWLVVGDLHIGFEEQFLAEGYRLKPSTANMEKRLLVLIQRRRPHHLVILGDVKHSIAKTTITEWKLVPEFLERISKIVPTSILLGNHDGGIEPLVPRRVKIYRRKWLLLGDLGLTHGHTRPAKAFAKAAKILLGHLHATVKAPRLGQPKPAWITVTTSKKALLEVASEDLIEVVVMPSFNLELATLPYGGLREKPISPLFSTAITNPVETRVLSVDGEVIGSLELIAQRF